MKSLTLVFLFFFTSFISFGITVEEVIKKMQATYSNAKSLEYDCTYELYKGHKSSTVHTSYNGYVYKEGNRIYQKIQNSEFIYGSDFFLKINHDEKAIVLDKAQKNINLDVDLQKALKECSEKTVEKKEGYYSVKLVLKAASEIPYSVIYLRIDCTSYFLTQMDFFYSNLQDFSTETNKVDEAYPRLKIKFKNTNIKPKSKSSLFSLPVYLKTQNSIISPTGSCAGYELIDNRL